MRFILTVFLVFLVFCWLTCLIYMLARDNKSQLQDSIFDFKLKWFYLVLFIVLTVMIVGLFYFTYFGGVL